MWSISGVKPISGIVTSVTPNQMIIMWDDLLEEFYDISSHTDFQLKSYEAVMHVVKLINEKEDSQQ